VAAKGRNIEIMSEKDRSTKKVVSFVAICLVLVSVIVSVLFILEPFKTETASAQNPIAGIKAPKKPSTTTTTTLPVPMLPQPENAPEDPYEKVPVVEIGSVSIPKINMTQPLYDGVSLTVLNVGPGYWPGTAKPGEYGNTVIAGHRVTHSKPFRNIDQLVTGDEIIVTTETGKHVYKVTGNEIVFPKDIWIVDQTPGFRITLFACHPPGSAKQRYVVYGELVDPPFEVPTNV
jgi:sortase A